MATPTTSTRPASTHTSQSSNYPDGRTLPTEELNIVYQRLLNSNKMKELENVMFESYISRYVHSVEEETQSLSSPGTDRSSSEASLVVTSSSPAQSLVKIVPTLLLDHEPSSSRGHSPERKQSTISRRSRRTFLWSKELQTRKSLSTQRGLLIFQMLDIVQVELDFIAETIAKTRKQQSQQYMKYRCMVENTAITLDDTMAGYESFKELVNSPTCFHKLMKNRRAERVTKILDERAKNQENMISKIHLWISLLKTQTIKNSSLLESNKALIAEGSVFCPVDFQWLKILNSDSKNTIIQRTQERDALRKSANEVSLQLMHVKADLDEQTKRYQTLNSNVQSANASLNQLSETLLFLQKRMIEYQRKNQEISEASHVIIFPSVLEYIKLCGQLDKAERIKKLWAKKYNLTSIMVRNRESQWRTLYARYSRQTPGMKYMTNHLNS